MTFLHTLYYFMELIECFRLISRCSTLLFGPFNDFSPLFQLICFLSMNSITWVRITKRLKYTAQKMKFSIKDFFSKCDQIRSFQLSLI